MHSNGIVVAKGIAVQHFVDKTKPKSDIVRALCSRKVTDCADYCHEAGSWSD